MVALTGIEPAVGQFGPVQLGLSSCVFSTVGFTRGSETPPRRADVTAQSQRRVGRGARTGLPRFGNGLSNHPNAPEHIGIFDKTPRPLATGRRGGPEGISARWPAPE